MSAYKKLNQQDAYISTYTARKSWVASGSQYQELGIQNIVGLESPDGYIVDEQDNVVGGGANSTTNQSYNRRLIHNSAKHLYYSLFNNANIESTGSFENYLQSSFEVSGSRKLQSRIAIFSLPKEVYGTHIEPFSISIKPDLVNSSNETGSLDNYIVNDYMTDGGATSYETEDNLYIENSEFLFGIDSTTCGLSGEDYVTDESDYVDESQQAGGQYLDSPLIANPDCTEIVDDGEGRLYIKESNPRKYVGNAIYTHGQLIITDLDVVEYYNTYINAILSWKSNLPIYTHNYHCKIKSGEYNHTLNRTAVDKESGQINELVNIPEFQPYFTTIGLYNDSNELIAVAKTGQPIPKSADTDMVVQVKLDMNFGVNRLS